MSKGSRRRPTQIDRQIADLRYDLAFGNKEQKEQAKKGLINLGVIKKEDIKNDGANK